MEQHEFSDWDNKKEKIKQDYPQLTSDDLLYELGKEEELLQRLQEKLNKTKKEIRKWLSLMG